VHYEAIPQIEQRMDAPPATFGLLLQSHDYPNINMSNWATNSTMIEAQVFQTHPGDLKLSHTAFRSYNEDILG
jgi:hypothetical protein